MASNREQLKRLKVVDEATIQAGESILTEPIDISSFELLGSISLQIEVSGSGTLTTNYLLSNSYDLNNNPNGDFVKPVSGFNIAELSSFTETSGTDSNGKDHANISMRNAQAFKLEFSSATNPLTISAWLSLQ